MRILQFQCVNRTFREWQQPLLADISEMQKKNRISVECAKNWPSTDILKSRSWNVRHILEILEVLRVVIPSLRSSSCLSWKAPTRMSMDILDSNLLHGTVHHLTKFQADMWNLDRKTEGWMYGHKGGWGDEHMKIQYLLASMVPDGKKCCIPEDLLQFNVNLVTCIGLHYEALLWGMNPMTLMINIAMKGINSPPMIMTIVCWMKRNKISIL